MKFLALTALVAVAYAQDEEAEAVEALEAGADCSAEGSVCGDGLCCGTASGSESEEGAGLSASWTRPPTEEKCWGLQGSGRRRSSTWT